MSYPVHTIETAPEPAKETLAAAKKALGFVPNLLAVMADAPALVKGYTALSQIFDETSFNAAERQVVLLTVSYENACTYCVAAHSVIAGMQKVPEDVVPTGSCPMRLRRCVGCLRPGWGKRASASSCRFFG